jgi:hypothetical protein
VIIMALVLSMTKRRDIDASALQVGSANSARNLRRILRKAGT